MPYVNAKATGENLKALMKEKGITVKALQGTFGFANPQAVYNWLSGKSVPNVDNLVMLSIVFKTSLDDLLVVDMV